MTPNEQRRATVRGMQAASGRQPNRTVQAVTPAPLDWSEDLTREPIVNRRPSFVAPAPTAIVPRRVDILPPEVHAVDMPTPATAQSLTRGSHLDRAMGFRHAMMPVAGVAGMLGSIAAVALFGVPVLSFALLMWFFTVFCATWLFGYMVHTFVSADGATVLQVLGMYRILSREQKARLRRMERDDR